MQGWAGTSNTRGVYILDHLTFTSTKNSSVDTVAVVNSTRIFAPTWGTDGLVNFRIIKTAAYGNNIVYLMENGGQYNAAFVRYDATSGSALTVQVGSLPSPPSMTVSAVSVKDDAFLYVLFSGNDSNGILVGVSKVRLDSTQTAANNPGSIVMQSVRAWTNSVNTALTYRLKANNPYIISTVEPWDAGSSFIAYVSVDLPVSGQDSGGTSGILGILRINHAAGTARTILDFTSSSSGYYQNYFPNYGTVGIDGSAVFMQVRLEADGKIARGQGNAPYLQIRCGKASSSGIFTFCDGVQSPFELDVVSRVSFVSNV